MAATDARAAAVAAVEAWVAQQAEVTAERLSEVAWDLALHGQHKRTIGAYVEIGEHTLVLESHFMRAPDEGHADLYGKLLTRNLRTYVLRFALSPSGDLLLVAVLPLHAVTVDEFDRLLGQLLVSADSAFDEALRTGFASYIDREQAWRARSGLDRNPIS